MTACGTSALKTPMPKVGDIHTARISMISMFGDESRYDPDLADENQTRSSASSSSSSSKGSRGRIRKRPVLIWRTSPTTQVLVMSRFSGVDVTHEDIRLFDNLTKEYVLQRLIPVYPKKPYGGKRSISAEMFTTNGKMKTIDTNLILMPTPLPEKWRYKVPTEYFPPEELRYINEILHQIDIQNSTEQMKLIESIEYPPGLPSTNDPNDKEDNKSSSTSSSVPEGRGSVVIDIHLERDAFLHEWLDHVLMETMNCSSVSNNSEKDVLEKNQLIPSPLDYTRTEKSLADSHRQLYLNDDSSDEE